MIATEATKQGKCPRCGRDILPKFTIVKMAGVWVCHACGTHLEENPEIGELEGGVLHDLDKLPEDAAGCSIAKASLRIARIVDSGIVSPRDLAGLIKELRQNRAALMELYPTADDEDPADAARKNREAQVGQQWEEPPDNWGRHG